MTQLITNFWLKSFIHAYGFNNEILSLFIVIWIIDDNRTKIKGKRRSLRELNQGVLQGFVLEPLFFSIYLKHFFILSEFTDICNFADDTTFYVCDMDLNSLIKKLELDSFLPIGCFENNNMKLNQNKCHFLVSGY